MIDSVYTSAQLKDWLSPIFAGAFLVGLFFEIAYGFQSGEVLFSCNGGVDSLEYPL
jgi:hypothetical protein